MSVVRRLAFHVTILIYVCGHVIVFGVRGDTVDEIIGDLVLALADFVGAGGVNDLAQCDDWVRLAGLANNQKFGKSNWSSKARTNISDSTVCDCAICCTVEFSIAESSVVEELIEG